MEASKRYQKMLWNNFRTRFFHYLGALKPIRSTKKQQEPVNWFLMKIDWLISKWNINLKEVHTILTYYL